MELDSALGGDQTLPAAYNISELLKERMEEVVMLTESIQESPFRGQTFQRLPKHMRRRQMSHHIKRLPRKLQRPYLLTLKEGLPKPTKCPSRKYRRRPGNLLAEYNRRQKLNVWVETHIWHAKRFHMVKKWGYSLPESPTNKSFRACYRAISEHCLMTDISYYNCIELKGPESKLLQGLTRCTSKECGLTFGAKMYMTGTKEGSLAFYHPDSYPYQVIGNISFIWKPFFGEDSERTIWIWVHPAIHNEMVECLSSLFNLKPANNLNEPNQYVTNNDCKTEPNIESTLKKKFKKKKGEEKSKIEKIKLEPKNVPFDKTLKYSNESDFITMSLLKDTLNRFRLMGPLSQAIISQAFNTVQVYSTSEKIELEEKEEEVKLVKEVGIKRPFVDVQEGRQTKIMKTSSSVEILSDFNKENEKLWWEEYYIKESTRENWKLQRDFYKKLMTCSKPTDVPSHLVLSVVIGDPRLTVPEKREKAVTSGIKPHVIPEDRVKIHLADSPLWNSNVRDKVSLTKLTTYEINEARSKKIVPGFDADDVIPDDKKSKIPILLIQRPGVTDHKNGRIGFGSGWDVISPAGYGMPIWQALTFRGGRCGGLREMEMYNLESQNLHDFLQPDSQAGKSDSVRVREELERRHFGLPPNKRPNYIKLGVPTPFHCPWDVLIDDWIKIKGCSDVDGKKYAVLRSGKTLKYLGELLRRAGRENSSIEWDSFLKNVGSNFLIPVLIECPGKGKPRDFAMICLPEMEDFEKEKDRPPEEKLHEDKNQNARKELKKEHAKLLNSLRRKRKKDREILKEEFAKNLPGKLKWTDIMRHNSAPSDEAREEYKKKMESLWIPSLGEVKSVAGVPDRKIMGYVVKGDFTFSKSASTGLGYVTAVAFFELLKVIGDKIKGNKKLMKVLVRNRDQVQYKFAKLTVLEN